MVAVCHLYKVYSVRYYRSQRHLGRQQAEQGQQCGVSGKACEAGIHAPTGIHFRPLGGVVFRGFWCVVLKILMDTALYRAILGVANMLRMAAVCACRLGGAQSLV